MSCYQLRKNKNYLSLCISMESSMKRFAGLVSVIITANTVFAYLRKGMENNRKNIPKLLYKAIVLFKLVMLYFLA